jgi:hypothetical protein
MKFDPRKHQRRSIRLKGYDYAQPGAYFVTLCAWQREDLFGAVVNGEMHLNPLGQIVHDEWLRSMGIRQEIRLYEDEFVVMPNHLHGIVCIVDTVGADGVRPDGTHPNDIPHNGVRPDGTHPNSEKEAYVCGLLANNNLPSPPVIALDTSAEIIPAPYIIQKHFGGAKLEKLLEQESKKEKHAIFFALGNFYKRLHSIHHPYSGWIDGLGLVYTKSPNEHQFEEVIMKIGNQAVELGKLAAKDHKRLQRIWIDSMGWLKDHQPSLGGVSLYWTVYLARENSQWYVTKIMDLEDLLY